MDHELTAHVYHIMSLRDGMGIWTSYRRMAIDEWEMYTAGLGWEAMKKLDAGELERKYHELCGANKESKP